jgi:hypothetical protein
VLCCSVARAQGYPSRPLRIVVPFSPGGAVDGPTRAIAQELGKRLRQQVIVDNKPDAGATLGSEAVARSPPDGYTLLPASQTNAISATLYPKVTFAPVDGFVGISLLGHEPSGAGGASVAAVQERGRTDRLGPGAPGSAELCIFGQRQRAAAVHGAVRQHGRHATRARALPRQQPGHHRPSGRHGATGLPGQRRQAAAAGGQRRRPLAAIARGVDTGRSGAHPGNAAYVWPGLLAPRGTPAAIVERLNRELRAVLALPEVRTHFAEAGIEALGSTPEEMDAYFRDERDRWARVAWDTGAKID